MKKKNIIFAIVVLAVILIFIIGVIIKTNNDQKVASQTKTTAQSSQVSNPAVTENIPATTYSEPVGITANSTLIPTIKETQVILKPKQTEPIVSPDSLPSQVIKLDISSKAGFSPKEFTVKANTAVTVAITSMDNNSHTFNFHTPSLTAVTLVVIAKETRAISFNTPKEPGAYPFFCDINGHTSETGTMIVK